VPDNLAPPESPAITCAGWAPGLNIPDGECVHCHVQKRDHPRHTQGRASGAVGGISQREFALADSPLATHPSMISPASSAAKVRPDVVFCRSCNQGMIIKGVESGSQEESDYSCPKCSTVGPKSKTPSGVPHGTKAPPLPTQETPTQIAFTDGMYGVKPRRPDDKAYMEWFAEGNRRRNEPPPDPSIIDAEFSDAPQADTAKEPE